ncbi:TetR/AcrR family transcriptional regulator [Streptomyces sp. ISL-36]|uniref:TetR/AcrR family transcriptional regulator n=1 Tax=Streptomyces sp. ISL-36 TaxID=2819182 RepID=UPI001BECA70D|nr:TetR/AcrR family transcriptional regulator [Streptomyces sp. ISL-36]MBT2443404.1 TetR/AcrR family transcriptional regulator [Streptomyces sp. ISL-36]
MHKRSEQTRQALVRATAELIADGRLADAGLVNICRVAGVSRGALYHHFSSTAELVAEVRAQASARTTALVDDAFAGQAAGAPARLSAALGVAMSEEQVVRAGMRLGEDGTDGSPRLRDEVLSLMRARMVAAEEEAAEEETAVAGGAGDRASDDGGRLRPADLALVVTAGLQSLGYTDRRWWDPETSEQIWGMLEPLFAQAEPAPAAS